MPHAGNPGQRKRESEVLQAAVEVFRSKGYSAATIQDIAERVGVLKGSLYYYIRSKEQLLARIFDEINAEARAIVTEVANLEEGPLERLQVFIERYTFWYLTNFERVGLYFSEWPHLNGELLERELSRRAEFERFIRSLIEEAQRASEIDMTIQSSYATFFLLGGVNSAATWYRDDGADPPARIAGAYARMAVGLLCGTVEADAAPAAPLTSGGDDG